MNRDLVKLSNTIYDVLVIGGGIYGVCVAWDAALRGLSVALVEKGDFGHATSANTLRIIHGGLRHLQSLNLWRARQSARERMIFMRMAPHLVQPLPVLIPTYERGRPSKELFRLALQLNDLVQLGLDREQRFPRWRLISKEDCLRRAPGIETKGLTGGVIFYDCQMRSSERLILALARSAAVAGADLANYVEVADFLGDRRRVVGVKAKDVLTGDELEIRAKISVNASGPWLWQLLRLLNNSRSLGPIGLSKSFNLLIHRQLVSDAALGVYAKKHAGGGKSRFLFITPWRGGSLIGTAHLPYGANPDDFTVSDVEVQAFLDQINDAYPAADLTRQDVSSAYAGLVPTSPGRRDEVQLMKRYRIYDHGRAGGPDGLISVIGVKFTEARYVAEKVVDRVVHRLGRKSRRSATTVTPVYGGQIERFDEFLADESQRPPHGLNGELVRHLAHSYGSAYPEILRYLDTDSAFDDAHAGMGKMIRAETRHAIRDEMAEKLGDVIFRRITDDLAGLSRSEVVTHCADVMAAEFGWGEARKQQELQAVCSSPVIRLC